MSDKPIFIFVEAEAVSGSHNAYMMRDRDTGEEYVMYDPPGGTFRDQGDEYVPSEISGIIKRDRRDGYWKNGDCVLFRPEGEARKVLLDVSKANPDRLIRVPQLSRTLIFPDGYEVIEDGSEDGWLVWQWCVSNATSDWEWVNLGADGGPWLSLSSVRDQAAFLAAFPELNT